MSTKALWWAMQGTTCGSSTAACRGSARTPICCCRCLDHIYICWGQRPSRWMCFHYHANQLDGPHDVAGLKWRNKGMVLNSEGSRELLEGLSAEEGHDWSGFLQRGIWQQSLPFQPGQSSETWIRVMTRDSRTVEGSTEEVPVGEALSFGLHMGARDRHKPKQPRDFELEWLGPTQEILRSRGGSGIR